MCNVVTLNREMKGSDVVMSIRLLTIEGSMLICAADNESEVFVHSDQTWSHS